MSVTIGISLLMVGQLKTRITISPNMDIVFTNQANILRSIQNNQTSLDDAIKQINNLQQENINKLTELFNKNEYIMDIIEDSKKSNELTKIGLSNVSSLKDLNNLTKKELDELLKLDMKDYETLQILLIINNIYKKTIKSINPK